MKGMNSNLKITLWGLVPALLLGSWVVAEMPVYYVLISIFFFLGFYLVHVGASWYAKNITYSRKGELATELGPLLFFCYYIVLAIVHFIVEVLARYTNNFGDTLSCRGEGCVLLMGIMLWLPFSLVAAWQAGVFVKMSSSTNKGRRKGYLSDRNKDIRKTVYWLATIALFFGFIGWIISTMPWS